MEEKGKAQKGEMKKQGNEKKKYEPKWFVKCITQLFSQIPSSLYARRGFALGKTEDLQGCNLQKQILLVQMFYGLTRMEPMLTVERLFPAFIYHSSEMLIPHKFFSFKFQMSNLNLVAKQCNYQ